MKKIIYILFLFILQVFVVNESKASHVMGSDITYTCLGNNMYHVIVSTYRDCNGIQISPDNLNVKCSTGATKSASFSLTETTVNDITGVGANCPISSKCAGANYPYGIEQHIFEATIDLSAFASAGCCWVTLSWAQCCRNGAISTGASGANFYSEAKLNLCVTPCNNSPTFTSKPAAIICEGQNFVFNNGALDTLDGKDSLSYDFLDPLSDAGTTISYSSPYSKKAPLTYLGAFRDPSQLRFPAGFILDTTSGDILTRPMKAGEQTVFVIQVTEWRKINGVMTKIGITRRDIQIIVIKCPNNKVPEVTEPTNTYKFTVCAGDNICINFNTKDADTADTVVVSWNGGIPGATFRHNNKQVKHASGSVCWTPGLDKVSNIPYSFTVTALDNGCPQAGQAIRSFQITVRESPEADYKLTKLPCGNVAITYKPKKSYPGFKATWKVENLLGTEYYSSTKVTDTLLMQPGTNTVKLVMSTSSPCYTTLTDTVVIDPYVRVDLPADTYICKGDSITLSAIGSFGPIPYKYEWTQSGKTPNPTGSDLKVSPDTLRRYTVKITDAKGCINYDSMYVDVKPLPDISIPNKARICQGTSFLVDAGNDTKNWKFQWNNGAGDTLRYLTPRDSGQYIVKVTDENFCVSRDTFNLFVNKVPLNIGPDTAICENSFYKGRAKGADSYEWSLLPDPTVMATTDSFKVKITKSLFIMLKATKTYENITCSNTDTVAITFNPLPPVLLNIIGAQCRGRDFVNLTNLSVSNPTQLDGIWTSIPNTGAIRNGNEFVIDSVPGPGQKIYSLIYTVKDEKGCVNFASTPLIINDTAETSIGDLSLCGDVGSVDLKTIMSSQTKKVGQQIAWLSPDQQLIDAITRVGDFRGYTDSLYIRKLTQGASYTLILELTDAITRCVNYDTATITSRVVPIVDANKLPSICENDTTLDLDLAAIPTPSGGFWFAKNPYKNSVKDSVIFNPKNVANGANKTINLYYTYDIPNNNCPVTDSTTIFLKEKPALTLTTVPDVCETEGSVSMMNFVSPRGGAWSGDGKITKGGLINTKATGPGVLKFHYEYMDINSKCKNDTVNKINIQKSPKITVFSPPAACEGNPFAVNASPGGAKGMTWSAADGADGFFSSYTDSITSYTPGPNDILSKGFKLCAKTISSPGEVCPVAEGCFNVTIYANPIVTIKQPESGCVPLEAEMNATSIPPRGVKFTWDFGDPTSPDNTDSLKSTGHRYDKPGTYTVTVNSISYPGGCPGDKKTITVEVYPNPVAYFTPDRHETTILSTSFQFKDGSTIASPGFINQYHWDFGTGNKADTSNAVNPMFEYPTDTGLFPVNLLVTSDKGCFAEYKDTIMIRPDITVFIPNAFTPNAYGPHANEKFFVHADGIKSFNIRIFDRWGEQVYQSDKLEEGWDGIYKGEPAQQDVYVYRVDVISNSDKDYSFYGTITLLR